MSLQQQSISYKNLDIHESPRRLFFFNLSAKVWTGHVLAILCPWQDLLLVPFPKCECKTKNQVHFHFLNLCCGICLKINAYIIICIFTWIF